MFVSSVLRGWAPGLIAVGGRDHPRPSPLGRSDTHPQDTLGTFEAKMAARKGRCSIPVFSLGT